MEVEDLEPNIDKLDDVPSSQLFTKAENHYANMVDYHEKNYFEQESHMP